MTTYSYTVTLNDSEHIYLEQLLNEKIKQCKESHEEASVEFYTDILYKLNCAHIERRSYTEYDENGISKIKVNLTEL